MSKASPRVYVLYTGGTIGMDGQPLAPMRDSRLEALLGTMPGFDPPWLTLHPLADRDVRIAYTLDAFDEPIDSSSMMPRDWVLIARRVLECYADYDGFVVLHGTDTMAWT